MEIDGQYLELSSITYVESTTSTQQRLMPEEGKGKNVRSNALNAFFKDPKGLPSSIPLK